MQQSCGMPVQMHVVITLGATGGDGCRHNGNPCGCSSQQRDGRMSTFEDILARDGVLVYKTRGASMEPMLRQNRDLVVIRVPSSRLEKYDVALYKRGEAYILHRVLEVNPDRYLIRGDNTYTLESVPDDAVIGVLTDFQRKGRQISADSRGYKLYVRFWIAIYPLRFGFIRICRIVVTIARRLGITAIMKRIMRKESLK